MERTKPSQQIRAFKFHIMLNSIIHNWFHFPHALFHQIGQNTSRKPKLNQEKFKKTSLPPLTQNQIKKTSIIVEDPAQFSNISKIRPGAKELKRYTKALVRKKHYLVYALWVWIRELLE